MKSVTVELDKTAALISALAELASTAVYVGIPESEDARKEGDVGNATIGYAMEFGLPANNVPARPFLIPGIGYVQGLLGGPFLQFLPVR